MIEPAGPFTVRCTRHDDGREEIATTDSIRLAVILCESMATAGWWHVELEDCQRHVLWATYMRWDPEPFAHGGAYPSLHDIPIPD